MSKELKREQLLSFVKAQFKSIANVDIDENSKLCDLNVSEVDIIEILMEIEMQFDCELNDAVVADIFREKTVKELLDYIETEIN